MPPCPLGLARECYCTNHVSSFGAGQLPAKTAALLLAHGSPDNPEQVPEFLNYVTGGRPFAVAVVEEIRHRYSLVKFSPLTCWTLLQADQLSQAETNIRNGTNGCEPGHIESCRVFGTLALSLSILSRDWMRLRSHMSMQRVVVNVMDRIESLSS
jgi:hypothetical protein